MYYRRSRISRHESLLRPIGLTLREFTGQGARIFAHKKELRNRLKQRHFVANRSLDMRMRAPEAANRVGYMLPVAYLFLFS